MLKLCNTNGNELDPEVIKFSTPLNTNPRLT